jgi:hypothetical protein
LNSQRTEGRDGNTGVGTTFLDYFKFQPSGELQKALGIGPHPPQESPPSDLVLDRRDKPFYIDDDRELLTNYVQEVAELVEAAKAEAQTDWGSLSVDKLKYELKSRGLAVGGVKAQLVLRLETSDRERLRALENAEHAIADAEAAMSLARSTGDKESMARATDELRKKIVQECLSPLVSRPVERGVASEAIKGAVVLGAGLSAALFKSIPVACTIGLGAAYIAVSPGSLGQTIRNAGAVAWDLITGSFQFLQDVDRSGDLRRKIAKTSVSSFSKLIEVAKEGQRIALASQQAIYSAQERLVEVAKLEDEARLAAIAAAEAAAIEEAETEAARIRAEEEAELARIRFEEEAARLRALELENERRRAEEDKAAEESRIRAEEEARIRAATEERARIEAEEVARKRAEKEAAARRRAEKEETARRQAEEEAMARRKAEEQARIRAEEKAARIRAEEEKARIKAEEVARKQAEKEAAARRKSEKEETARRKAEEEATARQAQDEARIRAEEEAARIRGEEERARIQAEEAARKQAEEEALARIKAGEEAARIRADNEDTRAREREEERRRDEEEEAAAIAAAQRSIDGALAGWDEELDGDFLGDVEKASWENAEQVASILGRGGLLIEDNDESDDEDIDYEALGRAARAAVEEFEKRRQSDEDLITAERERWSDEMISLPAGMNWAKMTVSELRSELEKRGLPGTGKKAELVSRLEMSEGVPDEDIDSEDLESVSSAARAAVDAFEAYFPEPRQDWNSLTVTQLRNELKSRGLPTAGKKADLIAALEVATSAATDVSDDEELSELDLKELGEAARMAADIFNGNTNSFDDEEPSDEALWEIENGSGEAVASYESMSVADLKEVLKRRRLPVSGKKADLIARLQAAD